MPTRRIKSESKFLERARTALANAQTNPEIKSALSEYDMGDEALAVGQQLFNSIQKMWEDNIQEDAQTTAASLQYKTTYNELQGLFKMHRNKTLIFLKKRPELLVKLGVQGRFPHRYDEFFNKTKQFYSTIKTDTELQAVMVKLKITEAMVDECLALLNALLAQRSVFDTELAESQDMTKNKNAALIALKEWIDDFDISAKIALYDQPQLLEALGIFVRS